MTIEYRHLIYYKKIQAKLFWKLLFYAREIESANESANDYSDSFKMTYDSKGVEIYYMESALYEIYKIHSKG